MTSPNPMELNDFVARAPLTVPPRVSGRALLAGRLLRTIPLLFLVMDAGMKLLELEPAQKGTLELGFPPGSVFTLGTIQFVCLLAAIVPRTAVLGTILLTGYLGGAVATHLRLENPLFSHTLFPIYLGVLLWGGLILSNAKLRKLLPVQRAQ